MISFDSQRLLCRFAASLVLVALLIGGCSETVIDSAKLKAPAFANAMKTLASESSIADRAFIRMAANKPASDTRRAQAMKLPRDIKPDDLMTWAESAFPDLFPGNQATLTWQNYQFRFYPGTQTYLAVDNSDIVWVFSPLLTGGQLVELGPLSRYSAWVSTAIERFAAARQLEQASFGPSPSAVEELVSKGFEAWLDEQLVMKPSLVDSSPFLHLDKKNPKYWDQWVPVFNLSVEAPDQLRQRVSLALIHFIVVSQDGGGSTSYGLLEFYKMLQLNALGNYRDILRETTTHATMGWFLGNAQNRAVGSCDRCTPSENYARELMQLFSLGVYLLNPDGTYKLDPKGQRIATYTQRDVEELARALTGWVEGGPTKNDVLSKPCELEPINNRMCYDRKMYGGLDASWGHDTGQKVILGRIIPANQGAPGDLESILDILMSHPNIAPFVSKRLIQHLSKSNPSPGFIRRVSEVFVASRGDMRQTIKAVLTDPEARLGDNPLTSDKFDGRIKEPMMMVSALWRGMGCTRSPLRLTGTERLIETPQIWFQYRPLQAPNVFGYFSPDHRSPNSGLLAPEQTLLTPLDIRVGFEGNIFWWIDNLKKAGCDVEGFSAAFRGSEDAYLELINQRFFRGYMSFALRSQAKELMTAMVKQGGIRAPEGFLLSALLMSPEYRAAR